MTNLQIFEKLKAELALAIDRREWNAKIVRNGDRDKMGGIGNYDGQTVKAEIAVGYYAADAHYLATAIQALESLNYAKRDLKEAK